MSKTAKQLKQGLERKIKQSFWQEKIDLYLFWQVACCNGLMDATTKRSHLACVALLNITFILK